LVRDRGAPLEIEVAVEARALSFQGDADRLLQALLNLVGNAFKFSPPGSRVRVCASVDSEEGHRSLRVTVDDQGPGVPEALRDTLFEPFRQGEVGDARGAGLGLAIVRGIVAAHGGSVGAADTPGGGARFVVSLPLGPMPLDPVANPGAG
jgi:two-component system sensor histidine kinase KdpD